MSRWIAWSLVGLAVLVTLRSDTAEAIESTIFSQQTILRLDVVLGRISVQSERFRLQETRAHEEAAGNIRELLSLDIRRGRVGLQYDFSDSTEQLRITVRDGDQFELRYESSEKMVSFVQQPTQPVRLVVEDPQGRREQSAASLWHLMLDDTGATCKHLVPLLEVLRPDWNLQQRADQVRLGLLRAAEQGRHPDHERLERMVQQLSSGEVQQRRAAMHELMRAGFAALPVLDRIDPSQLDAEQRARIRTVRKQFQLDCEDTPERMAAWLSGEKTIWLTLLVAHDPRTTELARRQLARVSGESIAFEHVASDADRRRQAARLRSELGIR